MVTLGSPWPCNRCACCSATAWLTRDRPIGTVYCHPETFVSAHLVLVPSVIDVSRRAGKRGIYWMGSSSQLYHWSASILSSANHTNNPVYYSIVLPLSINRPTALFQASTNFRESLDDNYRRESSTHLDSTTVTANTLISKYFLINWFLLLTLP